MAACDWTIDTGCCPGWSSYSPEVQQRATDWAIGILDALTGYRFEQCPVKLRPCGSRCGFTGGYLTFPVSAPSIGTAAGPWMVPYIANGLWRNCACGGLGCSCRATCEAHLDLRIAAVTEVRVDGLVLDPSAYRVDNGNILVRTDGLCWPECQDMDLPDTAEDTWSVTVVPGELLPRIGQIAAGELACQFAKACVDADDCRLPAELISMTRNGVQVQVADPQTLLENGLTGFVNVDTFIRAANPNGLKAAPQVLSLDLPRSRRVTL